MAGRPPKYANAVAQKIISALRAGNTRRAACAFAGISEDTLARWLKSDPAFQPEGDPPPDAVRFSEAVTRAEDLAEFGNVTTLAKAASEREVVRTETASKPVWRSRIARNPDGEAVVGADGEPVWEEYLAYEVTTKSVRHTEFDWRAALEWLKRRRREEWGDRLDVSGKVSLEDVLSALPEEFRAAVRAELGEIVRSEGGAGGR